MARCEAGLAAMLKGFEEELVNPRVRKDAGRLIELLAEDFREFGSSGRVFTRDQIVALLAGEQSMEFTLHDFVAERFGDGCVLVTYCARRCEGGSDVQESLRSSIWIECEGRWQVIFHQGTKVDGA